MHNAPPSPRTRAHQTPRFAAWKYFRFDIPPADLPAALGLFHAKKFHGLNLTVPHKIIAFECVAEVDPAARPLGAVNTLRRAPHGWHGFNTDGYGLAHRRPRNHCGRDLAATHIVLLGAGGAWRAARRSNASPAAAPPCGWRTARPRTSTGCSRSSLRWRAGFRCAALRPPHRRPICRRARS